jgi:hypothetical protein
MPYPDNLNTTDPRSPEYEHCDRDEAEAALEEANASIQQATESLYDAFRAWEDGTKATDANQIDIAGLAAPIAALAHAFPHIMERNQTAHGVVIIGRLLNVTERLMRLRLTKRSAHLQGGTYCNLKEVQDMMEAVMDALERAEGGSK